MQCDHTKLPRSFLIAVTLALFLSGCQTSLAQPSPQPQPSTDAGSAPAAADQPRVEVAEIVFNYGEVQEGETIRHDFKVKNAGLAELQITKVNPG